MFKKLLTIMTMVCLGTTGLRAQCPTALGGPDDTVCVNSSATLAAALPEGFTGTWTRIGNNPAATITSPENPISTVTGLTSAGNLRLIWTISNTEGCRSADTITILISAIPTASGGFSNANAGTDPTICAGGTATLSASLPAGSTGLWSKGGGVNSLTSTITNPSQNQTTVTGLSTVSGATQKDTLRWTVTNSYCAVTVSDNIVITVNAAPTIANGGADRQKCQGDTIRLIGNSPTSGTPSWVLPVGNAASFVPANSGNNDTVTVQGNTGGQIRIAYRIANGSTFGQNAASVLNGCLSVDSVNLTFGPASANAGPDQVVCQNNLASITLAAAAPANGTAGTWTFVKKKGNEVISNPTSPTSTVTGISSDTLILRWTVSAVNCTSSDDVTIRISARPSTANAGQDITACLNDTVTISGSAAVSGNPTWATTGNANGISFIPNTQAGRNNDTIRFRGTAAGTYSLVYTIAAGSATSDNLCISRDTVRITVNPAPTANAGSDQTSCSTSTFILNGNRPSAFASGQWSLVGSTGTITAINDTAATVNGLAVGNSTLRWTVRNTFGCTASNDLVITYSAQPSPAIAREDRTGCAGDTITLIGSTPTVGTPSWAVVPGGPQNGITFIPNTNNGRNNDTVRIRLQTGGTYNIVYYIAAGNASLTSPCTSRDTVEVTVNAAPVANAGPDQSSCTNASSFVVSGNRPAQGATGTWTISSGTGTLTGINDTASTVSNLLPGTTTLTWTIENIAGCSASNSVNILTGATPVASAGANVTACANDTIQLTGTTTSAGQTPTWTILGNAGSNRPTFQPNGNNDTVRVIVRGNGAYTFVYTVSVGTAGATCTSRDTLVLTVKPSPSASIVTGQQLSCRQDSTYTIRATRPAASTTSKWSISSNSTALFVAGDTSATVSNLPVGVTTVQFTVLDTNGCDATATSTITRNAVPTTAAAGQDLQACLGDTVTLIGSTPLIGTPSWSTQNSQFGTIVGNTGNDTVRVRLTTSGVIRMRYRISNGSNTVSTGCASVDTLLLTASACTGLFDGTSSSKAVLLVHPNPASGSIHVLLSNSDVKETEIALLSLDGKIILNEYFGVIGDFEKEIDLVKLPKGMYVVRVKKGNQMEYTKLVVQ